MATTDTFQLSIVTPEKAVLETDATFVSFPAHDGQMGVLAHRAPLLVRLGVGWLSVEAADGDRAFLVDGGFAQMVGNRLTVLTERAERPDEIEPGAAREALEAAAALPSVDDLEFEARQRALERARAMLKSGASK